MHENDVAVSKPISRVFNKIVTCTHACPPLSHPTEPLVTVNELHMLTHNFNYIVFVVVQFGFWFNLDFPLFFSMLIYDNEYQTNENPN